MTVDVAMIKEAEKTYKTFQECSMYNPGMVPSFWRCIPKPITYDLFMVSVMDKPEKLEEFRCLLQPFAVQVEQEKAVMQSEIKWNFPQLVQKGEGKPKHSVAERALVFDDFLSREIIVEDSLAKAIFKKIGEFSPKTERHKTKKYQWYDVVQDGHIKIALEQVGQNVLDLGTKKGIQQASRMLGYAIDELVQDDSGMPCTLEYFKGENHVVPVRLNGETVHLCLRAPDERYTKAGRWLFIGRYSGTVFKGSQILKEV